MLVLPDADLHATADAAINAGFLAQRVNDAWPSQWSSKAGTTLTN
jgi:hypothetical protein